MQQPIFYDTMLPKMESFPFKWLWLSPFPVVDSVEVLGTRSGVVTPSAADCTSVEVCPLSSLSSIILRIPDI